MFLIKRLSQKLAVASLMVGGRLLFQGWQWGYNRNFTWKGNFEYTPRNIEEIPRPFEQVFENYVMDQ